MKSFGIILFALATGAAAHPFHLNGLFSRQAVTCAINSDCPATEFCAGSTCEEFTDCRGTEGSCPGGTCAPTDGDTEGDAQDPTRQYQCDFPDSEPSPSASASESASASASASEAPSSSAEASASASASESASSSVSASSAPSASASSSPVPGGECAVNADCAATQFCDLSGETAVCAQLLDCRGEVDSCPGGFCVAENATSIGDAQDPSRAYICSFEPAPSASVSSSASLSASVSSSPSPSASSSSAAVSSSAIGTITPSSSPSPSPSATVAPTQAPAPEPSHPAPEPEHPAPKPEPEHPNPEHPKDDSKPAPAPQPEPEHPKDDSKDDSAWRDEYKDNKNGKNYCDQSKIEDLLWQIKGELKGLKWEVEQLKASKH